MNPGIDWFETFRPAILCLLNGQSPYCVNTFYNVPWTLFPLIPFALFPEREGVALLLIAEFVAFLLIALRFTRNKFVIAAFLFNPFTVIAILVCNVEWLTFLGLIAFPPIGFLLLAIKPQITVCVMAFLLYRMWLRKQWKLIGVTVATGSLALGYTLVFTPLLSRMAIYVSPANMSLGLGGVPVGLAFLVAAWRTRKIGFAIAASPFFAMALSPQTWVVLSIAAIASPIVAVSWTGVAWFFTAYAQGAFR